MSKNLQVKGVPENLHERLSSSARRNFRSLNQEALARIEFSFEIEDVLMSKVHQQWIDEAMQGKMRPGSFDRLRDLAEKAKARVWP